MELQNESGRKNVIDFYVQKYKVISIERIKEMVHYHILKLIHKNDAH